jgi:protein phosphatase 2C-like protein
MHIEVLDIASRKSGSHNEDRAGSAGTLAWVIDGATDLVEAPLVGEHSDAAWLAEHTQLCLQAMKTEHLDDLADVPARVSNHLADAFVRQSRRQPAARWEHPSAAATIIRTNCGQLEWVSLGDCALIVETPAGLKSIGVGGPDTGDSRLASALQRLRQKHTLSTEAERRSELLPRLRKGRGENLNLPGGYGVISITPPPRELITTGRLPVESSSHVLLATDGLMRLVEIFERYDAQTLLEAAKAKGLASLLDELRGLEAEDSACLGHPRLKQSDDATGLLMRIR